MNAPRRKRIQAQLDALETIRAELECLAQEEQDAWEAIPEAFIDKQDAASEAMDALNEVSEELPDLISRLGEAIGA